MSVDLSSFGKALLRLEEALDAHRAGPANELIRDAVIKRFEFTYELAQSTMRRFVEAYSTSPRPGERLATPELVRTVSQDKLLRSGWDIWHGFREARNKTSHAYNEDNAVAVLVTVPCFFEEAKFLHTRALELTP